MITLKLILAIFHEYSTHFPSTFKVSHILSNIYLMSPKNFMIEELDILYELMEP